jgi:4-nitrophenyl phosphatase
VTVDHIVAEWLTRAAVGGNVHAAMSCTPAQIPHGNADDGAGALRDVAAVAFDLDGTIYLGSRLLPGAIALLDAIAAAALPFVFATNNSSRSGEQYLDKLRGLGLPADRARLVTSNDVAVSHLKGAGLQRPYLLATPEVEAEYRAQGIEPSQDAPDCVLLTFDTTLTYEKLRRASDLIRGGVRYLATHPDLVCPTSTGPIPDCGAFIALLAEATGQRPLVLGKPHGPMALAIRERLDVAGAPIAYVGDRLYTDVRMANEHGFVAVLTLTGETERSHLADSPHVPDVVVADMAELHGHLRRAGAVA